MPRRNTSDFLSFVSSRGTISMRKSKVSERLMATATSFRCKVRLLHSSVCIHARRVSSKMNISQALAKTMGAYAGEHAWMRTDRIPLRKSSCAWLPRQFSWPFWFGLREAGSFWNPTHHARYSEAGLAKSCSIAASAELRERVNPLPQIQTINFPPGGVWPMGYYYVGINKIVLK